MLAGLGWPGVRGGCTITPLRRAFFLQHNHLAVGVEGILQTSPSLARTLLQQPLSAVPHPLMLFVTKRVQ